MSAFPPIKWITSFRINHILNWRLWRFCLYSFGFCAMIVTVVTIHDLFKKNGTWTHECVWLCGNCFWCLLIVLENVVNTYKCMHRDWMAFVALSIILQLQTKTSVLISILEDVFISITMSKIVLSYKLRRISFYFNLNENIWPKQKYILSVSETRLLILLIRW